MFSGMFRSAQADETTLPNSQNIALLEAALNTNPNPISKETGDLTVVGGTALYAENGPLGGLAENQKNQPSSDQISIYVVRSGDTLSMIAQMFGVSTNTIRWNNDLQNQTITPGQTLVILPVTGVRHAVKKGDTIKSIAKLYDAEAEEIKSYNDIVDDTALAIGEIVIVPGGEIAPAVAKVTTSSQIKIATPTKTAASGYFIRPTTGPRTQGVHGSNGVDIAPPTGTPIVASAAGTVIISRTSGYNGGYGVYVVIKHSNGTQTLYSHMSKNVAIQGGQVAQGEVIGYVGSTGKVTGPHLHFEVRGAKNPF